MGLWTPTVEKASWSLLIVLMRDASIAMAEDMYERLVASVRGE